MNHGFYQCCLLCLSSVWVAQGADYRTELSRLRNQHKLVELKGADGLAQLAIGPRQQGRVLAITDSGLNGAAFGGAGLRSAGEGYVGRILLGPVNGPWALRARSGGDKALDLNALSWSVERNTVDLIGVEGGGRFANAAGGSFDVSVIRRIRLLDPLFTRRLLKTHLPEGCSVSGYVEENVIENRGGAWSSDTGLLALGSESSWRMAGRAVLVVSRPEVTDLAALHRPGRGAPTPLEWPIPGGALMAFPLDGTSEWSTAFLPEGLGNKVVVWDRKAGVLSIILLQGKSDSESYLAPSMMPTEVALGGPQVEVWQTATDRRLGIRAWSPATRLKTQEAASLQQSVFHIRGNDAMVDRLLRQLFGVGLADIEQVWMPVTE